MPNRKPNTSCDICGTLFYKRPSSKKQSKGNYCSKACYGKACRKPVKCVQCGTEILAGKHAKTCSPKCYKEYSNSPNRKHSLGRPKKPLNSLSTRSVKRRVLEERGGKCEVCGYNKTPVLEVHHILEKSKGGTDNPDNLIVLCRNCHGEVHSNLLNLKED